MDDESAASEAVRNLNGHSIKGRAIKVEKSESKGKGKYGINLLSNFFCSFLGSYICIFFKVILISQMNAQTINKHLVSSTFRVAKKRNNNLILCLHMYI